MTTDLTTVTTTGLTRNENKSVYSKQRHNRLWQPDSECDHPDCQQAPSVTADSASPKCGTSYCDVTTPSSPLTLEFHPSNPQNQKYYFRRLPDSELESGPSVPVQAPPPQSLDVNRVFIAIEDVERDALLDAGFTTPITPTRGAESVEELRLRLEFNTVEEEEEEEIQALVNGERRGGGTMNHLRNENSNNNNHHSITVRVSQ